MGAGPSLGKFLKNMDDDDLVELVENAYKLEPQRMEKIFALVKMRYFKESGQQQEPGQHQDSRGVDDVDSDTSLTISTPMLSPTTASTPSSATAMLSELLKPDPAPDTSASITTMTSSSSAIDSVTTTSSINAMPDASNEFLVLTEVRDPMNALWSFKGHPLRELQPAVKNPQNTSNRALLHEEMLHADHLEKNGGEKAADSSTGAILMPQRAVDADGYPVIYGSCGRDKRYGRCSVCYFRGLRCNTAHYCASCQRSVCIRPRKYPGEEHHKICWNVLHMDKDMIQRVEKKKKRKLQAVTAAATTTASVAVPHVKNVDTYSNGEVDTGDSHGQNDSLSKSVVDVHRAPSILTVVADVSGAVNL
ncbi:unnamed protein product [Peronospora belbahrii]|uniref:HIT-type domain-containing protein n=1 Tax=Peronospora belbahrii TaxID=622444 RepID=A0AAU9KW72_9STRA|nr:unnamed protein product [Peronospora belbahrii]CAH0514218.1 unnamed protein product [Peronospora belbahrii]